MGSLLVNRLVKLYKNFMHSLAATHSVLLVVGESQCSKACYEVGRLQKAMEGFCKAWVLSKELFTLLQEFVCKMYASQTSLFKVNDLIYQLFRVKKGDVDSSQLPPYECKLCDILLKVVSLLKT